jgi:hypothetical protein
MQIRLHKKIIWSEAAYSATLHFSASTEIEGKGRKKFARYSTSLALAVGRERDIQYYFILL